MVANDAEFVVAVVIVDSEPIRGVAEAKFATKRIATENKTDLSSFFIISKFKNRLKSTVSTKNLVCLCADGFVGDGQMKVESMFFAIVYGFHVMQMQFRAGFVNFVQFVLNE